MVPPLSGLDVEEGLVLKTLTSISFCISASFGIT